MAQTLSGSINDIKQKEFELLSKGFKKSNQTNDKFLQPKEYIIRFHSGTADSFEGPSGGTLIWLEP